MTDNQAVARELWLWSKQNSFIPQYAEDMDEWVEHVAAALDAKDALIATGFAEFWKGVSADLIERTSPKEVAERAWIAGQQAKDAQPRSNYMHSWKPEEAHPCLVCDWWHVLGLNEPITDAQPAPSEPVQPEQLRLLTRLVSAMKDVTANHINQDEQGGCVFCEGRAGGHGRIYATQDSHHTTECPWKIFKEELPNLQELITLPSEPAQPVRELRDFFIKHRFEVQTGDCTCDWKCNHSSGVAPIFQWADHATAAMKQNALLTPAQPDGELHEVIRREVNQLILVHELVPSATWGEKVADIVMAALQRKGEDGELREAQQIITRLLHQHGPEICTCSDCVRAHKWLALQRKEK